MLICSRCFRILEEKGCRITKKNEVFLEYEEAVEFEMTCDLCGITDTLYSCYIENDLSNSYNILREMKNKYIKDDINAY